MKPYHSMLCLLAALTFLLWPSPAWACQDEIKNAWIYLRNIRAKAENATQKTRERVDSLLQDAAEILDEAKEDCDSAEDLWDRSWAVTQSVTARGYVTTALGLIKTD